MPRRRNKHYSLQRGKPPMWKGYKPSAPFSRDPRQLRLFDAAAPATPPAIPAREPQQINLEEWLHQTQQGNPTCAETTMYRDCTGSSEQQ